MTIKYYNNARSIQIFDVILISNFCITSFKAITMFCSTDNILHNIPHV